MRPDLAGAELDQGFDGWSGETLIRDHRHRLRLRSRARRLVLFTPPGAAHFCVEPVSHAIDAIQAIDPLALGLFALAPGRAAGGWMQLTRLPDHDQ